MLYIEDFTWSKHVRFDRQERMVAILMTIGFGEIKYTKKTCENKLIHFTSTGCILITGGNTIITAYVASHSQMLDYFSGNVPIEIRRAVKNSNKKIEWYLAHH